MGGKAESAEFRDILRAWLEAALPLLNANRQPFSQVPPEAWAWDLWLMAGVIFRFGIDVPDLRETQQLAAAISHMPEFVHRGKASDDPGIELTKGDLFQAQLVVAEFVRQYLREAKSGNFAPEVFSELYSGLEEYLYRFDDIHIRMTIELWNAESDAAPISLAHDVVIRALTDAERAQSRDASRDALLYPPRVAPESEADENVPTPALLIEVVRSARVWAVDDTPKLYTVRSGLISQKWSVGHRVLLSLRLLQREQVWLGHARTIPGNRFLGPELETARARPATWENPYGNLYSGGLEPSAETSPYRIGREQVERLAALYAFLDSEALLRRELDVPLRRFEMSFGRTVPIERFVDLWIALEGLFSPGGAESSFRMQQYIAQFVGRDAHDRWRTYSTAKDSYKARNDVLHGRKFLSAEELAKHGRPTEDYARRALLKCIEERRKPHRQELEKDIFLQGAKVPD